MNIRLSISATNVKDVTKACQEIVKKAKEENNKIKVGSEIVVKGPWPMPTRTMRITTRKTPCGEGSKTWDRYQMRVHKRIIGLECAQAQIMNVTSIHLEPGVHVELSM